MGQEVDETGIRSRLSIRKGWRQRLPERQALLTPPWRGFDPPASAPSRSGACHRSEVAFLDPIQVGSAIFSLDRVVAGSRAWGRSKIGNRWIVASRAPLAPDAASGRLYFRTPGDCPARSSLPGESRGIPGDGAASMMPASIPRLRTAGPSPLPIFALTHLPTVSSVFPAQLPS